MISGFLPATIRGVFASALLAVGFLQSPASADPIKTHPRLLFRAEDLPNLRARMNPANEAWTTFKTEVVDKCLRDWKCSATHHYSGPPNYQWIRDSFTDEFGVTHLPTLPNGDPNPDWGQYSNQSERPAAPEDDVGEPTGNVRLFSEQYAMIFAFMARLLKDDPSQSGQRAQYLAAAKECLFTVVDHAHLGADGSPWRASNFAQNDRSFSAEAFPLTVDLIYEDLTSLELAKIRKSFLIWAEQSNEHIYFAPHRSNGQHGPINSPELLRLDDPIDGPKRYEPRLALNNHYANHARQLMLYALAFDPKDDLPVVAGSAAEGIVTDEAPAGSLTSQIVPTGTADWVQQPFGVLRDTIGVWLYLMDYAYRHDGAGGISMEGTQYASNGLGPAALMMAALHMAGQDDVVKWGPQVTLKNHPFWSRMIPAYLALLSPAPRIPGLDTGENYHGPIFQPPLTGDLETYLYLNNQFIKVLAPMALYDAHVNGPTGQVAQAVRYIQRDLAPGGAAHFEERMASMRSNKTLRDAIYTFLIFDPSAPPPADPRPALQEKTFISSRTVNGRETGMIIGRSGSSPADTYFYTHLGWVGIDHVRGDSLTVGLWKNGLWLTKPMTGYGVIQGCSDYRNSLSLQNGVPTSTPVGEDICAEHGSQWNYSSVGDPQIVARSFGQNFLYVNMDGTALYQHGQQTQLREVTHASRRMVWLKPDILVIHDAASSKQAGFFKRVYFNTPEIPQVNGHVAHASAKEDGVAKAELFVSQLLPTGVTLQVTDIASGQPSGGEDMKARLFTEAPGGPQEAHFLHVLQGANGGVAAPDSTTLIASSGGTEFDGALVGTTAVLFKHNLTDSFSGVTYTVPISTSRHFVTGLQPNTGYDVALQTMGGQTQVQISPAGLGYVTDSGGVLVIGDEPIAVSITPVDTQASEEGQNTAVFKVTRSGSLTQPLLVKFDSSGGATAGIDYVDPLGAITIPANSAGALLTITPLDDTEHETAETVTITLSPDPAYSVDDGAKSATAVIADNDAPSGGYIQFSSSNFDVNENGGAATITVKRMGGSAGTASALVTVSPDTALTADVETGAKAVSWNDGETADKTVSFAIHNNAVYGNDKLANLTLSSVTGAADIGTPGTATLTIHEDEPAPPGQIMFSSSTYTATESADSFGIALVRVNGRGGATTVNVNIGGGSATLGADYTLSSQQISWDDGDSGAKLLTVTVINDQAFEGSGETFTLTLSIASGAATLGATSSTTITINDDDPEPQQYDIGDGFPYPTIGSVPWKNLGPGAVARIHWRSSPYHEKLLLSGLGTSEKPIVVRGVRGPNGERPVIDGGNATSSASLGYESSSYTPLMGIVAIARGANTPPNAKVGHIQVSGLEIRGSTDANFVDVNGDSQAYWSSGGALYLRGAEQVTIRDCELHHAYSGLVAECYSSETEVNRDVLIENCWFHDNAKADSYSGNNLQIEGVGMTVQGCRFDPNLNRDKTASIRDRSAGATYRYNLIEGGSYLMELIEPSGAIVIVTGDANYATSRVYGNTLINRTGDGSSLVRFGAAFGSTENFRTSLYFYDNTVVTDSSSTSRAIFSLAGPTVVVEALDNILFSTSSGFQILNSSGVVNLGVNWAGTGWTAGNNGVVNGAANVTSGVDPGFVDFAGNDFRLTQISTAKGLAQALPATLLPADNVKFQFHRPIGKIIRPNVTDVGAFAYFPPIAGRPPFAILSRTQVEDGLSVFTFSSTSNMSWQLEGSPGLTDWRPLDILDFGNDGTSVWEDFSDTAGQYFFRLRNPTMP
jgi:hypothetical protein